MKSKTLLLLINVVCATLTAYAYEVPTSLQKKNILLEEFTGIHCGYCPQGHTIAKNMQTAQPDIIYVIAVHSGMFSQPSSDEPDFRTEDGDLVNNTIGAGFYNTGYPSGMINRHTFGGTIPVTGRADWTKDGKEMSETTAPVNLLLKSSYDGSSRQLAITVEGYFTEEQDQGFNLLNVALVQSNIKGPQNGGAMGSDYIHNHMLRDYLTPEWGDTIKAPKKGEYFTRTYSYTLPETIKEVDVKAEDIELIAFVCTDKTEVLNVTGGKPIYTNFDKPLNATIYQASQTIKSNYGYNFFEGILKNESNQTITSAEFQVSINGADQQVNWNGGIHAFESRPIVIKVTPYEFMQQNECTITLTKLNGQAVEGNSIKYAFDAPYECTPNLEIELQTDLFADENSYAIKDQDGQTVIGFGPYPTDKKAVYKEMAALELGKIYCFEVTDSWGDGIQQPMGNYKIYNQEDHSLIVQQYDIKLFGDRFFFKTSHASGIDRSVSQTQARAIFNNGVLSLMFTPSSAGTATIELYSATGFKVNSETFKVDAGQFIARDLPAAALSEGVYFIRILDGNHSQVIKTVIR